MLRENLKIYTNQEASQVQWSRFLTSGSPLTWYKTLFDAPAGDDPIVLDLGSMGKGKAWINGESIGRYWVSFHNPKGITLQQWYTNYAPFCYYLCQLNLTKTQQHPPSYTRRRGWIPSWNFHRYNIHHKCPWACNILSYPPVSSWLADNQSATNRGRRPKVQLNCPPTSTISIVLFANYGNPSGNCNGTTYDIGSRHSTNSKEIIEKACLGKRRCSIALSKQNFGGDPCPGISKALLADAQCT